MDRLTIVFPHKDKGCPEFTEGKEYEVLSIEDGCYRVVDDWGMDCLYPPEFFEDGKFMDGVYFKP